jgi:Fe2+ or Zn2+ uptake regulation protein
VSPTFTVRLAEAPADVLEVLADHDGTLDPAAVHAAIEHPDATEIQVRNALSLLRDLGLASQTFDRDSRTLWAATDDGRTTIQRARAHAHEADRCAQVGHEMRPAAGGRIACTCCGVPAPERGATPGTFREGDS